MPTSGAMLPVLTTVRHPLRWIRLRAAAQTCSAFLASYPKSGRTWFRFILANYLAEIGGLAPTIDFRTVFKVVPNYDLDRERGLPAYRRDTATPLILVSHSPYSWLTFPARPVLFMVRNPCDLMVSAYFHRTRHKSLFSGDISAFLRDPRFGLADLIKYLNGWATGLQRHERFVFSYEQLTANPIDTTARALQFLGLGVDLAAVARAVARSRFEAMHALEVATGIPGHDYDRTDPDSRRVRRGAIGAFRRELRAEDLAWIETACARDLNPAAQRLLETVDFAPEEGGRSRPIAGFGLNGLAPEASPGRAC